MALRIEETPATGGSSGPEAWSAAISRRHAGWRVESNTVWDAARLNTYHLGEVTVVGCRTGACGGVRVADRDGTDAHGNDVGVLVLHAGRESVECGGRSVLLSAGEAILWDTRTGGRFEVDKFVDKSTVFLPRAVVESWVPHLDQLMERGPYPVASTMALRGLLSGLTQTPADTLQHQSASVLASALKELSFLTFGGVVPECSRGAGRLWTTLTRSIEDRLPAATTADELATDFAVSVRTVYQVFADNGTTVRAYTQMRRLAHAREDLIDPRNEDTVATTAHRWGFFDQSAFTKAFRGRYGITPGAVRRSADRPHASS